MRDRCALASQKLLSARTTEIAMSVCSVNTITTKRHALIRLILDQLVGLITTDVSIGVSAITMSVCKRDLLTLASRLKAPNT